MRSGIFYFLCLMILLEGVRYSLVRRGRHDQPEWLQPDAELQAWVDSLKQAGRVSPRGRDYDPNRLDDFSGYRLGLSPQALDALQAYRDSGHTLYNAETVQRVAGLPDSAMKRLIPRLRFPRAPSDPNRKARLPARGDLNRATAEQLMEIRGVGPVLSARIVNFRQALGGFRHPSQLLDVYGLPPEVAHRLMAAFQVTDPPQIRPVSLNTATVAELSGLLYITPQMAEALVARRERLGPYESLDQIGEVLGLPGDKVERIALYLSL